MKDAGTTEHLPWVRPRAVRARALSAGHPVADARGADAPHIRAYL